MPKCSAIMLNYAQVRWESYYAHIYASIMCQGLMGKWYRVDNYMYMYSTLVNVSGTKFCVFGPIYKNILYSRKNSWDSISRMVYVYHFRGYGHSHPYVHVSYNQAYFTDSNFAVGRPSMKTVKIRPLENFPLYGSNQDLTTPIQSFDHS